MSDPAMNPEAAAALIIGAFELHGEITEDGRQTVENWVLAPAADGTPRPELYADRQGAVEIELIARQVRQKAWIPMMIKESRGGFVDRRAVLAVVHGLHSATRHCDDDPPPDGAAG